MNELFIVKRKYFYSIIFILLLSIIVGNRGATNDTQGYYDLFKSINDYDLLDYANFYTLTGMEPGIGFIFKFINFFSQSPLVVFSIISFLIFIFYIFIAKNMELNPFVLLFLYIFSSYFIFQQFMQIRQGLSTFIFIYAALLLFDKRFFSAALGFFFAITFHQSAILPVCFSVSVYLFTRFYNINKLRFLTLSFLSLVSSFFVSKYFLLDYLILSSARVESYIDSIYGGQVSLLGFNNIRTAICYYFILFLFLRKFSYLSDKLKFLFLALTVGIGMKFGMMDVDILSGRLTAPFMFVELLLMPYLIQLNFSRGASLLLLFFYSLSLFVPAYFMQIEFLEFLDLYFSPLG
ncbi:EpsG family protein [Acinetobacter faecalis]|uniref:EpsG family protein n=1 Tax=Acinetobacter faecalis TaxID=2665161 RepID=A0AB35UYV1_9GAMM|nr:EpsG family protein [Acinetobacter faecalis]MDY6487080.1 EpsG family protein [Acinetobacter faecalis]